MWGLSARWTSRLASRPSSRTFGASAPQRVCDMFRYDPFGKPPGAWRRPPRCRELNFLGDALGSRASACSTRAIGGQRRHAIRRASVGARRFEAGLGDPVACCSAALGGDRGDHRQRYRPDSSSCPAAPLLLPTLPEKRRADRCQDRNFLVVQIRPTLRQPACEFYDRIVRLKRQIIRAQPLKYFQHIICFHDHPH